jgi:hypothetical protein
MKYAVEMGSGVIHTKFNKDWFWHSRFGMGGLTERQDGDLINLRLFFPK